MVRFNLPMIDLWSYRLAARWRRWSGNQYDLRAWVRNSFLTSKLLRTPELNSVGTKTDVYLTLLIIHQKNCQVTKNWRKNRHAKHWSSYKQNSQVTKRWKISSLFMKNLNGKCNTFCYSNHSRHGFLKNLRLLFWPSFSTNNYPFTTEAI